MFNFLKNLFKPRSTENDNVPSCAIPKRGDEWSLIVRYAMTLNGYEETGSFHGAAKLANNSDIPSLTVKELRVALFFEWRRYNHFGYPPDTSGMEKIYTMLDALNDKLIAQQVDAGKADPKSENLGSGGRL